MKFQPYIIKNKQFETEGTHIYFLESKNNDNFTFIPGQWVFIKDPKSVNPEELHPFSIASSPLQNEGLEFCIKEYGDWTHDFSLKPIGSEVMLSEPQGEFVWDSSNEYVVFVLGGIGISPIMSMLRTIAAKKENPKIVLLYGNRTPETIAYKKELDALSHRLTDFTIVHVFSHLDDTHSWSGHKGFITKEIITKEVDLKKDPTFYFIGPSVFNEKIHMYLKDLGVSNEKIKTETLEIKNNQ